jgi:hypothetical protein
MTRVRFIPRNHKQVAAYMSTVAHGAVKIAIRAISEYILGDGRHGLKHYPPYKFVTRTKAYGKPFQTDKQRRWFFAALRDGHILPGFPRRTGKTQRGWFMKETHKGYGYTLENKEESAKWLFHDKFQARQPALVGWRKRMAIVESNLKGAFRHARAKVKEYLKER